MRGPGEFLGTRQSGLPDLRLAQISDLSLVERAREAARRLFEDDPELALPEHQLLAQETAAFWEERVEKS
jgi:ATP-dependent DNA helicase RecG